jgi:alkanesulfonate monooxygenase SsuD/methylene tetrahydromethanopterin reductase-like flavin-dependent oxidoreductase (luciferase family)
LEDTLLLMKFAIAIPQFYADGEFDPGAFRAYFTRAEELGFDSAWTQEKVLGTGPLLGRPAEDFPIAKRVYIAIDKDAGRARTRMNAALEGIYGHRSEAIEAAAVTGTPADCVRGLQQVADAGAELILLTTTFDQPEQMEQLAAAVLPELGWGGHPSVRISVTG